MKNESTSGLRVTISYGPETDEPYIINLGDQDGIRVCESIVTATSDEPPKTMTISGHTHSMRMLAHMILAAAE